MRSALAGLCIEALWPTLTLGLSAFHPLAALVQAQTSEADSAGTVDRFLRTLGSGHPDRLGSLVTDRVANGDGHSLRRSQIVDLHTAFTTFMFGPMRSFDCEPPAAGIVTCTLHFQSRSLRQRYTVTSGLISGIETIPFASDSTSK